MPHRPEDGTLETFRARQVSTDYLVEATFHNPYPKEDQYWEHGFLLKWGQTNQLYWVSIDSRGDWNHFYRLGTNEALGHRKQTASGLNTEPGSTNLFQVVLKGDKAWAYVNGESLGSFSITADTEGQRVAVFLDDEYEGETLVEDFTVWKWDVSMYKDFPDLNPEAEAMPRPTLAPSVPIFGPTSGAIPHNSEDGLYAWFRGPTIPGDVMVEVTFENPFAPNESHWNYGLQFQAQAPETYHIIRISSKGGGSWFHRRRGGPDDEIRGTGDDLHGLDLAKKGENHIRLIIIGEEGWLYVNERRAGIIPFSLGNVPNPERINLIINDIDSFGYEYDRGGETRFEDFTIWKWHPSLFELPKDD